MNFFCVFPKKLSKDKHINQFPVQKQLQYQNDCLENQKEEEIFFTIKVSNAGLSDQLTQLSKFYKLGIGLSYIYVHTPFTCKRSSSFTIIEKLVKKVENLVNKFCGLKISHDQDKIIHFLGLNKHDLNINDDKFLAYKIVNVYMWEIFRENDISEISQLKKFVEKSVLSSGRIIYSFIWTREMYQYRDKLNNLLKNANLDDESKLKSLRLSEKYWETRKNWLIDLPFDEKKIKVLVHLRKGDRASINLNNKVIYIFGSTVKLFNSIEDLEKGEILKRISKPTDVHESYLVLKQVFAKYGEDNFSVIVISDGYQRTFEMITRAIFKRELKLNIDQLKSIYKIKKTSNKEFKIFENNFNISTIIGESEENLFKSIHAIVSADIIIRNTGGFASLLNRLFRKTDQSSIIINLHEYDNHALNRIGLKMAKLSLPNITE